MKRVVDRDFLTTILKEATPADLRIVGRMLLHAAIVGVAAGLMGAAFFAALEVVQRLILEDLGGYHPLRAPGETFLAEPTDLPHFRPWLLALLPAVGALASGIISGLAPETRGGGGDAMITAFHRQNGVVRKRVAWVKALASIFTLSTGGSGGREGPTLQIGGALGSMCGWLLRVSPAERRILMVSGVAAGIAAVFRTPLGAALLAVEVLYRDDFESDALIPAVLASVVAYSVVIAIFGQSTLFALSAFARVSAIAASSTSVTRFGNAASVTMGATVSRRTRLAVATPNRRHRALHGLYRSLVANMVQGVTEGFKRELELVGVGYRATVTGQQIDLALGFSHNIIFELPKEIKASAEAEKGKNPKIFLEGIDKQLVGQIAAKIRSLRKPEPYKGKGVRYSDEIVRRKAGKAAGK